MGSGYAEPHRASRKMLIVLIESREFGPVFGGQGFESPWIHQTPPQSPRLRGQFYYLVTLIPELTATRVETADPHGEGEAH